MLEQVLGHPFVSITIGSAQEEEELAVPNCCSVCCLWKITNLLGDLSDIRARERTKTMQHFLIKLEILFVVVGQIG